MKVSEIEEVVSFLGRTPQVMEAMLNNLPERFIHCNEGAGTWSPFDVVGHLIHGEKTDWMERLQIILADGGNKEFRPFDREAMFKESKGKLLPDLLSEFRTLREKNLEKLKSLNLSEQDFAKTGIHPALGEVTLQQLLSTWAVHDLSHISQIERVIAKQYEAEVGPWKEYLRILSK